jgi:hypothetical protein
MINISKLAFIAAVAAVRMASPAFAQSHGAQMTGSASNREELNFGYYPSGVGIQNRQSGINAYATVPHSRTFCDYSPNFPGVQYDDSYNPAASGYDPGIETQR